MDLARIPTVLIKSRTLTIVLMFCYLYKDCKEILTLHTILFWVVWNVLSRERLLSIQSGSGLHGKYCLEEGHIDPRPKLLQLSYAPQFAIPNPIYNVTLSQAWPPSNYFPNNPTVHTFLRLVFKYNF